MSGVRSDLALDDVWATTFHTTPIQLRHQAYLKLGNWKESYLHLQQLLEFALSHNLAYYIGQSYRYMGEYYLNHGNPDLATPLLIKALNAFHEIGDINNREQTKNFAAVSAGQELMPKYIHFMLKCNKGNLEGVSYLQKLIRWKDTRDIAWSESSSVLSTINLDEALTIAANSASNLNTVLDATLMLEDASLNRTSLVHTKEVVPSKEVVPPSEVVHTNEAGYTNETEVNYKQRSETATITSQLSSISALSNLN
ncbi:hypothetical protein QE152_g21775 [Popillia japonica]|uniref:Tetratricopeptide repeat protein 29 n=1 Tax=Popillia japonica TaxID=7064 RepID=A0AAW1KKQ8_POPJA